ncbi:hypothetical protein ACMT4Y_001666, partial [Campylobacter jejuni]
DSYILFLYKKWLKYDYIVFYRDSYKVKKYKNILSKNVTILESKKHFWDIKFKIKARIYPPFKQHLISFFGIKQTFWDFWDIWDFLHFKLGKIKSHFCKL